MSRRLLSGSLAALVGVIACAPDAGITNPGQEMVAGAPSAATMEYTEWSPPVNLGPLINSSTNDLAAELSGDGLSLYFASNRIGGMGGNDIWVAHRASVDDPWEAPVPVTMLNSTANEAGVSLSRDGHTMLFTSTRAPTTGGNDLWMSWRADVHDDFAWSAPQNIGPPVNSAMAEISPSEWSPELYFIRLPAGSLVGGDLYMSERKGNGYAEPSALTALNTASNEEGPSIRFDGRELLFGSDRPGGAGGLDLWRSIRSGNGQPWEAPQPLSAALNTAFTERRPSLSDDGLTLFFDSDRPGGSGLLDLYMTTRSRK